MTRLIVFAFIVFSGCSSVLGQVARQVPQEPVPQAVALPGQIDLADLVELVSKRLGVSVQYQREAIRKNVSLRLQDPVNNDELWRVLTAVLEGQGFVVVQSQQPGLYRIVPIQNAAVENQHIELPAREDLGGDEKPPAPSELADRSSYVSVVLRLRSVPGEEVAKAVQPLLTPATGTVKPLGDGGLLLLSDIRRRVEQASAVIALLDRSADPAISFVIEFKAIAAGEAAKLLETVSTAQNAADPRRAKLGAGAAGGTGSAAPRIIPLAGDRRAMVICTKSTEPEIRRLLEELDQREPRETRPYSTAAVGVGVDELATSIKQLLDADRISSGVGAPAVAESTKVTADKLTDSVLVTASPKDHEKVAELINRLTSMPPSARQVLRSFVIKNRDAAELSQTLHDLLGAGGIAIAADPPGHGNGGTASADESTRSPSNTRGLVPVQPLDTSLASSPPPRASQVGVAPLAQAANASHAALSLTVDKPTNTIIAVGELALLAELEALVSSLDKRQPQVILDVSLVTLSDSESLSLGVELQKQFQEGQTTINLASLFGLAGSGGGALQGGTGFTGTVVKIGDYQAVVRALETLNNGRAVSMPKVLVNNNAKSTIKSVQRQPFTSINASNTVATTSFGGTQDAGTTVTVKPQITEGDHLVLDYSVELSAFTGAPTTTQGGGIIPPPSQQNTVEGNVTLPDGYTVVVGGLKNTTTGKSTSQVPLLGSIPILGALFGNTSNNDATQRFFVFIRATILRDPAFEDLRHLQAPDLANSGVDSGEPRLEPQWVE